jgi:hypothetical protein
MYEPGFMAIRIPWLRPLLRTFNAGPLFMAMGMLPLENELSSREISALAYSVQRRHGVLPLETIFEERVAASFPPGTTTRRLLSAALFERSQKAVKLATLREPYKRDVLDETRTLLAQDLARMEEAVRRGAIFYLTPEGRYSRDGRIGPMRGAMDRLAPIATIYLAAVSYDPFAPGRFSMLYRLVRLDDRAHLRETLAAIRPVTLSHLLAAWLHGRNASFEERDAIEAVRAALASLPQSLFVDPELRIAPDAMVRRALVEMTRTGVLVRANDRYALAPQRRHERFPDVADIVAYMANAHAETLENAAFAVPSATSPG